MTIPRRSWRGAGALVAAAVVGLTGGVISAGPAVAHTPTWAVTCSEVTVDLTNYTSDVPNTVTVSVDGKDLLPTETFGREFHKKLALPDHDKPVTVRLVVKDADGDGKHSIDQTKTAEVCEGEPSPTPTEPSPSRAGSERARPVGDAVHRDARAERHAERRALGVRARRARPEPELAGPGRDRFVVVDAGHRWRRCRGAAGRWR
ncbi:hypothetical protein GA0115255_122623, partial [Streptomyces sp. Ncost-T6T-2b]